jgi:hypothetical protein
MRGELNKGRIGGGRDFGVFRRRGGCVCGLERGEGVCLEKERGGSCLEDGG